MLVTLSLVSLYLLNVSLCSTSNCLCSVNNRSFSVSSDSNSNSDSDGDSSKYKKAFYKKLLCYFFVVLFVSVSLFLLFGVLPYWMTPFPPFDYPGIPSDPNPPVIDQPPLDYKPILNKKS